MSLEEPKNQGSGAEKIQARVESVLKEAELDKALRVIKKLQQGVTSMVMPERFSSTNIVFNRPYTVSSIAMKQEGLTEAEFKRNELLADLKALEQKIKDAQQGLEGIATEIAATELPGGWLS